MSSTDSPTAQPVPAAPPAPGNDAVSVIRGNEFRFVSSNTHRFRTTLNELSITFGSITDAVAPGERIGVYEHISISLTLGQVRLLVRELTAYLDEAEKFGAKYNLNEPGAIEAEERARRMAGNVFGKLQKAEPPLEKIGS